MGDRLVEVIEPETNMWVQFYGFFPTRDDAELAASELFSDQDSLWIRQLGPLKGYRDAE